MTPPRRSLRLYEKERKRRLLSKSLKLSTNFSSKLNALRHTAKVSKTEPKLLTRERFITITKKDEDNVKLALIKMREKRHQMRRKSRQSNRSKIYRSSMDPILLLEHTLKVAKSDIHGSGVFAIHPIQPCQKIIEYSGERIRLKDCDALERKYLSKGVTNTYLFKLDSEYAIDGTILGNKSKYINHSCDPNCFVRRIQFGESWHLFVISKRYIQKGEEITFDYCFNPEEGKIPCKCGTKKCRKFLN